MWHWWSNKSPDFVNMWLNITAGLSVREVWLEQWKGIKGNNAVFISLNSLAWNVKSIVLLTFYLIKILIINKRYRWSKLIFTHNCLRIRNLNPSFKKHFENIDIHLCSSRCFKKILWVSINKPSLKSLALKFHLCSVNLIEKLIDLVFFYYFKSSLLFLLYLIFINNQFYTHFSFELLN